LGAFAFAYRPGWNATRSVYHILTRTPSLVGAEKEARRAASTAASSKPKPALAPARWADRAGRKKLTGEGIKAGGNSLVVLL